MRSAPRSPHGRRTPLATAAAAAMASTGIRRDAARPARGKLHFPRASAPPGRRDWPEPEPISREEVGSGVAGARRRRAAAGRRGEYGAESHGIAVVVPALAGRELPPPLAAAASPLRPARGRTEKEGGRNVRFFHHRARMRGWGCLAALPPPCQLRGHPRRPVRPAPWARLAPLFCRRDAGPPSSCPAVASLLFSLASTEGRRWPCHAEDGRQRFQGSGS